MEYRFHAQIWSRRATTLIVYQCSVVRFSAILLGVFESGLGAQDNSDDRA
jgi:hypothetical protein